MAHYICERRFTDEEAASECYFCINEEGGVVYGDERSEGEDVEGAADDLVAAVEEDECSMVDIFNLLGSVYDMNGRRARRKL